jgi:sugar/nucleoside kinase (ribokinase family)
LAVIGNLTSDRVEGGPPRPGGGPFHAARALRLLARPAVLAVRCAARDRATLLPPLVSFGVPVTWRESSSTASFSFHYEGDRRLMEVEALGDPWTAEDVRGWVGSAVRGCEWVHVSALAQSDFPAETLAELARGHRVSLDGQGLVRPARIGPLVLAAVADPASLRHVSFLKLNEEEAAVLGVEDVESALRTGVPEIVVTLGARGSLVYAGGSVERVPPRLAASGRDPTGAGDAFTAAYLSGRASGRPPIAAARYAGGLVAGLLDS